MRLADAAPTAKVPSTRPMDAQRASIEETTTGGQADGIAGRPTMRKANMSEAKTATRAPAPTRQREQRELVRRAMAAPGVAEALQVYGRAAAQTPSLGLAGPTIRHATGGNT